MLKKDGLTLWLVWSTYTLLDTLTVPGRRWSVYFTLKPARNLCTRPAAQHVHGIRVKGRLFKANMKVAAGTFCFAAEMGLTLGGMETWSLSE